MATGTTMSKAAEMKRKARMNRGATSGNKNVRSRARRSSERGQFGSVSGMTRRVLSGPDRGEG